jgi:hypothetical protein
MKRSIAILAIAVIATVGVTSQTLEDFQTAFQGFTSDLAGSLAVNSTIGSNWSDAYVGGFPHFGAGIAVGAAFASSESAKPLFTAMNASLPSALDGLGVPIPAAVLTLKLGIPFLPFDVGVKGGYIPPEVGEKLTSSTGVSADYSNVGIQLRYALLKQNLIMPNLSIGASYNFQKGSIKAPTGLAPQTYTVVSDEVGGTSNIDVTSPELSLAWTSNTVDFTAQVSKQLLFLVPYAGVGYTIGKSSVKGGVSATTSSSYVSSGTYGTGLTGLNAFFADNGGPTISDQGFTYSADANDPVLRLYGGLSFKIILLDFDTQVMYVPTTKALGLSATTRVQL